MTYAVGALQSKHLLVMILIIQFYSSSYLKTFHCGWMAFFDCSHCYWVGSEHTQKKHSIHLVLFFQQKPNAIRCVWSFFSFIKWSFCPIFYCGTKKSYRRAISRLWLKCNQKLVGHKRKIGMSAALFSTSTWCHIGIWVNSNILESCWIRKRTFYICK